MKFDAIARHLDGLQYTSPHKGRVFYDFIMDTRPEQCLELGFAHGVSSCYIAAALHGAGHGPPYQRGPAGEQGVVRSHH